MAGNVFLDSWDALGEEKEAIDKDTLYKTNPFLQGLQPQTKEEIALKNQPSRIRSVASAFPAGLTEVMVDLLTDPSKITGQGLAYRLLGLDTRTIPPELYEKIQSKIKEYLPTRDEPLEKGLKRAGSIAPFAAAGGGGVLPTALITVASALGGQIAEESGMPPLVQSLFELGAGAAAGAAPLPSKISPKLSESGLPFRRFEKVNKPKKVSEGRAKKILETSEKDFRKLADDILKEHPTFQEAKSDPLYKEKLAQNFEQVREKAKEIQEPIEKRQLTSFMKRRARTAKREMKGITPSEQEATFNKEYKDLIDKVANGPDKFSVATTVDQYRKNSSELSDYFDPSKSKGVNKGKRDALLEYNRGIQELYETKFPGSEFSRIFKEQNKKWSDASALEDIHESIANIFPGDKINFKEVKNILNPQNQNLRRPYKQIMGTKGFNNFQKLLRDFTRLENPLSLIKKADKAGFKDLAGLATGYILHPQVTKGVAVVKYGKEGIQRAFDTLLDKPQLTVVWDSALRNLQKGNFKEAEKQFKELDSQVKTKEKTNLQAGKARTLPEGYSPSMAEKVTTEGKKFESHPSLKEIKEYNLKEPETFYGESSFEPLLMTSQKRQLYKNSFGKLFNENKFNEFYDPDTSLLGTAGDLIKDPKIRKIYKEVLDTPIYKRFLWSGQGGGYAPKDNFIFIRSGASPQDSYMALIHELHHALQHKYKDVLKNRTPFSTQEQYLKNKFEIGARRASRYATKNIQKAIAAQKKTEKLSPKSSPKN